MADYNLGTAKGRVVIDYDGTGVKEAQTDIDKVGEKSQGTGKNLDKAAKGMAIAGGVIAGGLAVAAHSAMEFEKQISGIAAVSGATGPELEKIRQKALQLGKDTQFSAGESAQAMEELVKAGLPLADVLNGAADATVALAAAGSVDMPEAATQISNAMNQFHIAAKDVAGVADIIAGAANASAIDVGEFGLSLKQVGAVANLAGLNFKDTAVAIAEMGQAGIKGSDAGTSLKSFLTNLIPTTQKQINLFEQLGLSNTNVGNGFKFLTSQGIKVQNNADSVGKAFMDLAKQQAGAGATSAEVQKKYAELAQTSSFMSSKFFDAEGNTKSLSEIQGVLATSLKGMSKEQKLAALNTLFGSDAIRAAGILADNGAAGYDKMAASMDKVKAADVAKTRMDNLAGSIEQLKGSAETLGIQLGTILIPAIRSIVDQLTAAANWFLSLPDGVQKTIVAVLAAASGFLLFAAALIKMNKFIKEFKLAMEALKALQGMSTLMSVIFGPWGLAILAVIALAILIYKNWDTIKAALIATWTAIKDAFGAAWDWIAAKATAVWTAITGFFVSTWDFIKSHAAVIFQALIVLITGPMGVLAIIIYKHWDEIKAFLSAVWDTISNAASAFGAAMVAIFTTVLGAIKAVWDAVWGTFGPLITAVFDLILAIINLALALWLFVIGTALNQIKAVFDLVWGGIKAVVSAAVDIISKVISTAWGVIRAASEVAWGAIKAVIDAVWGVIKTIVSAAVGFILDVVRKDIALLKAAWDAVWNALSGPLSAIWSTLKGIVSAGVDFILSAISRIGSIGKTVGGFFADMYKQAKDKVDDLLELVGGIAAKVVAAVGDLGKTLYNAGVNLIQGLIDGVTSMIHKLTDKLKELTDMIPDVKGPPTKDRVLLVENGELIMEGLIAGIESRVRDLRLSLTGITTGIPSYVAPDTVLGGSSSDLIAATGATTNTRGGDTYVVENVQIPAKDLEEMRTVQDFFDRIQQESRKRLAGV